MYENRLSADPNIFEGQPYVRTRGGKEMAAYQVISEYLERNCQIEDVVKSLSLEKDDVLACVELGLKPRKPIKEEDYAVNMWCDPKYDEIRNRYNEHRSVLVDQARKQGRVGYKPNSDVPPHIRNWFESPVYQTLIKPTKQDIDKLFVTSTFLTRVTFWVGVFLVVVGIVLAVFRASDPTAIVSLVSGTAAILVSLLRAAATLKDVAIQYAKLQIAISAGIVSVDALQRIIGHQERLEGKEYQAVQELAKALAPLIKAFENSSE